MKKIDIFISDFLLKINVLDKNFVKIFDLKYEIDFANPENNAIYNNDILEVILVKKESKLWDNLIETGLTKEEFRKRR